MPLPGRGANTRRPVRTDTACLAVFDVAAADEVWEDVLFDGPGHTHAAGGLVTHTGTVATHPDMDGVFPTVVVSDAAGRTRGFVVDLDPYRQYLAGLRDPAGPHPGAVGWAAPTAVRLLTDHAVFGDPAGLPGADGTGGLVDLRFPSPAGLLYATVFTAAGIRRWWVVGWAPRTLLVVQPEHSHDRVDQVAEAGEEQQ